MANPPVRRLNYVGPPGFFGAILPEAADCVLDARVLGGNPTLGLKAFLCTGVPPQGLCTLRAHGGFSTEACTAGLPTNVAPGGTSLVTTAPAPTCAPAPIRTPHRIVAPEPIEAPSSTTVSTRFQSSPV